MAGAVAIGRYAARLARRLKTVRVGVVSMKFEKDESSGTEVRMTK